MIGSITAFLGSMKSGKSGLLYQQIDKARYRKSSICLVKPKIDTRDFTARIEVYGTNVDTYYCNELMEIYHTIIKYDIICIDEGQFIPDIGICCDQLALRDKEIYISALNGTAEMEPWESISKLLPYCDNIIRCSAVCEECGKAHKATFSWYPEFKEKVVIGDVVYKVLCRDCWHKLNKEKYKDVVN